MKLAPARLMLKTGEIFSGQAPEQQENCLGEVVFNTGMVGYVESLTDPSYAGQILVFTYPLIGNYGVSDPATWESAAIYAKGIVVSEIAAHYSHHHAKQSLHAWLSEQGIPYLVGVDTRALTKRIRTQGVIPGLITHDTTLINPRFEDFAGINWVKNVSIKAPRYYGEERKKTVIVIDCGIKESIVTTLLQFPLRIKRVPYDYDFTNQDFDGVFISNGPGDPMHCQETIHILRKILLKKPVFGICLGAQLIALAAGAQTYKLSFGHRSHNQPCIDLLTQRCYLTSQNHSYAIDETTLPADWEVTFRNLNDQSVEGIAHQHHPTFAVQFHPEAAPGPQDTQWLFEKFYAQL